MNSKPILIYTTVQNCSEASLISKILLEKKLCACTNIIENMTSHFVWDNKPQTSSETILLIKTFESFFDDISVVIKENHSYSTPAILSIPIQHIDNNYLQWMLSSTK